MTHSESLQGLDFCECDNTHEQNDTVCRYCWSTGHRKWGDPGRKEQTMDNQTIREKCSNIADLRREIDNEHKKLSLTLELQELWPEAFDVGPCKTGLVDDTGSGQMAIHQWFEIYKEGKLFIRITRADGKSVDINARMASRNMLANHNFRPWQDINSISAFVERCKNG